MMIKRIALLLTAATLLIGVSATPAFAITIPVPGTSDPWLAGMPDGSTASGGDVAPFHSPVLVTGLNLTFGGVLTFNVSGGVLNTPGCPPTCDGPDGGGFISHNAGAENGISNITAPLNSLVGVFLDDHQPNLSPAPAALDFSLIGLTFASLSPALKQVFFIGDGLTGRGSGSVQTFVIPAGATRLFLATMDSFEWSNNSGRFSVTVTQSGIISLSLTLTGCTTCRAGDRLTVQAHVTNPKTIAVGTEVKIGVRLPSGTPTNLLGKHLEIPLPAGLDTTVTVFDITLPTGLPLGTWTFEGALLEPELGATVSRSAQFFDVVP